MLNGYMSPSNKPPADLELLTSLAKRFADRDLYEEADELFQLARRFAPNNMGIQFNLAEVRKHRRQSLGESARGAEAVWRERDRLGAFLRPGGALRRTRQTRPGCRMPTDRGQQKDRQPLRSQVERQIVVSPK